jgi:hypothetical protein
LIAITADSSSRNGIRLSETVLINTIRSNWEAALQLPSRSFECLVQNISADVSFRDKQAVSQHDGYAPVVEAEKFFVAVDVGEVGLVAELAE